jgi:hypothetical protein
MRTTVPRTRDPAGRSRLTAARSPLTPPTRPSLPRPGHTLYAARLAWCAEHGLDPFLARARIWSCISGGCRRSAYSGHRRSPGAFRSPPGSTGLASSTASWTTHQPSMCAVRPCRPSRRPWGSRTCNSRHCSPPPARVRQPQRLRAGGHARTAGPADLRSHRRGHQRPRRGTRPPGPKPRSTA